MKRLIVICSAVMLSMGPTVAPAGAQDSVTADSIIDALKPKAKTRSILQPDDGGLSKEDTNFIDGLRSTTRQIVVEEREQLAKIVKQQSLPSVDLEVFFELNSSAITSQAKPVLEQLGIALSDKNLKKSVIMLSGHTDATGSAEYNQRLSQDRANSVKAFLTKAYKVRPDQVIAVGYGEEQLKNTQQPDAAENRRVQIVNLGG